MNQATTTAGETATATKTNGTTTPTETTASPPAETAPSTPASPSAEPTKLEDLSPEELEERARQLRQSRGQAPRHAWAPPIGSALLAPAHYLWTTKSMKEGGEFEFRGEKLYRPLHGYFLGDASGIYGLTGPHLAFVTFDKAVVADASGKLVEAEPGRRVLLKASAQALAAFWNLFPQSDARPDGHPGCPVVHVYPTGPIQYPDGSEDWGVRVYVEQDKAHPSGLKLISIQSALGELASGRGA